MDAVERAIRFLAACPSGFWSDQIRARLDTLHYATAKARPSALVALGELMDSAEHSEGCAA